jgi:hypothetical protein
MRPKAEALGYLFVAWVDVEQRQERETAGSFPFDFAQGRNDSQKSKGNGKDEYRGLSTTLRFGRDDGDLSTVRSSRDDGDLSDLARDRIVMSRGLCGALGG